MGCPSSTGPCGLWDLSLDCCLSPSGTFPDPCLGDGTPIDQSIIDSAILASSQFLYAATGRQFGCCSGILRPLCISQCPNDCTGLSDSGYGFPWFPLHQADGEWVNVTCSQMNCTCVDLCEVPLPYPTCSIQEILIDGVVIPSTEYTITNFNKLIRTKANGCWPSCNDLSLPTSEPGTWSIQLTWGRPLPELVRLAAAEFACNLIKKCVGKPCDLPQRLSSISRQGMNATFLDPMEFLKDGMTGIFLVDLAISTYNPQRLYKKPWVGSPDSLNKWSITTWDNSDPASGCS